MDDTNGHPVIAALTEREMEILRLVADGLSNREIAQDLVITLGTVKWYARQIYNKLGVHSRTQAVARAREMGLFDVQTGSLARLPIIPKHNLPAQVTSFVGRQREITEIRGLLGTTRLLTLVGPPGTGKTRLGIQVAAGLVDTFDDGVYLVELAPISHPGSVANAIAQVLDVTERAGESLTETLKNYLRNRHVLLVLDNFEHILEATSLVSDLLGAAPYLRVLATSREALRLYGEQEFHVLPLEVPDLQHLKPLPELSQCEAVALFVHRTQAVQPNFDLTNDIASSVAEICVRLDGLPLAIELAAARSKMLTPQMIRTRLESRLGMLTGGSRDLPARHQTLHAMIDWSYDLLDEEERMLFGQLSVFKGGHSVEAAEEVCSPGLPLDVLDGLESLLNKNLLFQEEGPAGEPRFYMLETIHEYARARLEESGEREALQRRHAEYFVGLAERAELDLHGVTPGYWYRQLRAEHDNLQTALAWSLGSAASNILELGLRLVGALCGFWYYGGHSAEGLRWTQRALDGAEGAPSALRARVLNGAGRLAYQRGDFEQGKKWNRESLTLYRKLEIGLTLRGHSFGWVVNQWGTLTSTRKASRCAKKRWRCSKTQTTIWEWPGRSTWWVSWLAWTGTMNAQRPRMRRPLLYLGMQESGTGRLRCFTI
jgi:predicted ATPase/DNA-binding CsgD family transcriptional regulator